MRKLYILRHAKSDMLQGIEDKERPLSEDGFCQAKALAGQMRNLGYRPDFILCSPALRTRQTCDAVFDEWPDIPVHYEDLVYLASTGQLYEFLKNIDDKYVSALLVAHNPGVHGLVQFLAGGGDPKLITKIRGGYKAGSLSVFECDCINWAALMPDENRLDDLLICE